MKFVNGNGEMGSEVFIEYSLGALGVLAREKREKEGYLAKTRRSQRFNGILVLAVFLAFLASWREEKRKKKVYRAKTRRSQRFKGVLLLVPLALLAAWRELILK